MHRLSNLRLPSFDANKITDTIQRALASAGLDTTSGPMASVTQTIAQALSSNGMRDPRMATAAPDAHIDVPGRMADAPVAPRDGPRQRPGTIDAETPGTFQAHEFRNAIGSRAYKLYVPTRVVEQPPLVVMLHGCTQSADDFAAGTRMNRLAEEHGFLVVYPEQAAQANMSKCWNWFKAQDQVRDAGEPALIVGIVREVAARHGVDPRRIFVAGLSAGAAMAVVLGQAYPEVFAGVGAHSGLPYASAHDIPSAMAAMKGGRGRAGAGLPSAASAPVRATRHAVPTIVFHGDRDHTVQHDNGMQIVNQAQEAFRGERNGAPLQSTTQRATSPAGRSYSRTVHADPDGAATIESWTLHGAGHAWSGGHASGSYTDGSGPDASAEMIRFFLALPRAGSA
ncbi:MULTISPECIES: alpha/beta hydrolase family esterase [Ramlibacter]|uniref:PHB depolymerase family esterase n=1 Tax=Ramlibacter pinisoli TaxID=2682844 RepID=A0A6N8J0I1_9BURK|nr:MULTISPECIES: PHB depolymerase family esterase [Ramlibacter]MBA2961743.1 PHB depolymerase family esterase [Ramlibacter sp. CGMCC 1.13660]MVQ31686.1 PHB depolymerase family esterase [Ramlibacter pinisoli]